MLLAALEKASSKLALEFTPQEVCVGGTEEGGEAVFQKRPVYCVGECLPTSF